MGTGKNLGYEAFSKHQFKNKERPIMNQNIFTKNVSETNSNRGDMSSRDKNRSIDDSHFNTTDP